MARMKAKYRPHERLDAEADLKRRMACGEVTVGAAVRELRQRFAGLTIEEYARAIGISKTTLVNIERESRRQPFGQGDTGRVTKIQITERLSGISQSMLLSSCRSSGPSFLNSVS